MRLGRSLFVQILRAKGPLPYQPRATPWVTGNKPNQGPTARPIVAGRRSGFFELVPDIAFIVFDFVFLEEGSVFVLEGARLVMFLLGVDVVKQGIEIRWPDGKGTVSPLPRKGGQCRRLGFQPFGGRGFQFLDELSHSDRPGEADGEMNMVGHAADAEAFTIHIAGDRCEIGVQRRAHRDIEHGSPVFGAKDDVRQEIGERLGHSVAEWVGLSALNECSVSYLGRWPRLV